MKRKLECLPGQKQSSFGFCAPRPLILRRAAQRSHHDLSKLTTDCGHSADMRLPKRFSDLGCIGFILPILSTTDALSPLFPINRERHAFTLISSQPQSAHLSPLFFMWPLSPFVRDLFDPSLSISHCASFGQSFLAMLDPKRTLNPELSLPLYPVGSSLGVSGVPPVSPSWPPSLSKSTYFRKSCLTQGQLMSESPLYFMYAGADESCDDQYLTCMLTF